MISTTHSPLVSALAALALLLTGIAASHAQSVGVNFTGTDNAGNTFPLGFNTVAGIVPQSNWNDADGNFGNFQPSFVFDSNGNTPGIGIDYSGPTLSSSQTDASLGGNYTLTKGFLDINPPVPPAPGGGLPGVSFTGIPYASYDVYVYVDGAAPGTATYLLGTASQTVMTGTAYSGVFQPATGNSAGDYIRFSGLSGANFTLSGVSLNAAPVDGIQIVNLAPAPVPEASTVVSLGLMLALGAGGLAVSRRRRAV